jgi:hypothetical protein
MRMRWLVCGAMMIAMLAGCGRQELSDGAIEEMLGRTQKTVELLAAVHDEASAVEAGRAYYENSRGDGKRLHEIHAGTTAEQKRQNDKYGEQMRAVFKAESDAMKNLAREPKWKASFAQGLREAHGAAEVK